MRIGRCQRRPLAVAFVAFVVLLTLVACSWLCHAEKQNSEVENGHETSLATDPQESLESEGAKYQKALKNAQKLMAEEVVEINFHKDEDEHSYETHDLQVDGSIHEPIAKEQHGSNHVGNASQVLHGTTTEESESLVSLNLATPPTINTERNQESSISNDEDAHNPVDDGSNTKLPPSSQADTGRGHGDDILKADNFSSETNDPPVILGSEPVIHDGLEEVDVAVAGESSASQESVVDASINESETNMEETVAIPPDTIEHDTCSGVDSHDRHESAENGSTRSDIGGPQMNNQTVSESKLNEHAPPSANESKPIDDYYPDYLDLDDAADDKPTIQPPGSADDSKAVYATIDWDDSTAEDTGNQVNNSLPDREAVDSLGDQKGNFEFNARPVEKGGKKSQSEGSLASFFEKVKKQDQKKLASVLHDETPQNKPQAVPSSSLHSEGSPSDKETLNSSYCIRTWGVPSPEKRYANLKVLGMLFGQQLMEDAESRYKKVFHPVDLVIPTLYSKIMSGDVENDEDTPTTNLRTPPDEGERLRSVNTEFVEGLDDLDKFFEGVDPPDELDVGAAGASIQDVLMGQTSKIIIKRLMSGARYAASMFKAIKTKTGDFLTGEGRKLPQINKDQLQKSGKWVVERGEETFFYLKDLFQSVVQPDDEEDFLNYANDLEDRLKHLTGTTTSV